MMMGNAFYGSNVLVVVTRFQQKSKHLLIDDPNAEAETRVISSAFFSNQRAKEASNQ
jgi:hypothetical protein